MTATNEMITFNEKACARAEKMPPKAHPETAMIVRFRVGFCLYYRNFHYGSALSSPSKG